MFRIVWALATFSIISFFMMVELVAEYDSPLSMVIALSLFSYLTGLGSFVLLVSFMGEDKKSA